MNEAESRVGFLKFEAPTQNRGPQISSFWDVGPYFGGRSRFMARLLGGTLLHGLVDGGGGHALALCPVELEDAKGLRISLCRGVHAWRSWLLL